MRNKKKKGIIAIIVLSLISAIVVSSNFIFGASSQDYGKALTYGIEFFDANKCGKDVSIDNVFNWRGACHTADGKDVGVDLTGGYHDAGDHVKFGLPQGYAASVLGWSLYEFGNTFDNSGNKKKMLSTLKYFTDYFLKSHTNSSTFYYQLGEGDSDHTYWGPPEEQSTTRPTQYVANSSNPASDVLGETSAALTLMYLNYKSVDLAYADKCLKAAKELYQMGKTNQGKGNGQSFYQSNSYNDDLAWAACWLYVVEKDSSYITDIDGYLSKNTQSGDNPFKNKWGMCWDDMYMAVFTKMADVTKDQKYKDAVEYNLNYWINDLTTSPGGMKYLHNWGVLRYNAAASMISSLYYRQSGDKKYLSLAQTQIDYMLGNNPSHISYVIGYGSNWPLHPHHRAANGYTYANGDNAKPAKHQLTGALVGGPDQSDVYKDDVNQYQYTEVAIDYNASFVGGISGLIDVMNTKVTPQPTSSSTVTSSNTPTNITNSPTNTIVPTNTVVPTQNTSTPVIIDGILANYKIVNDWGNGSTNTVTIENNSNTAKDGWVLTFTFTGNQKISNLWNADFTQSGQSVVVKNLSYNSLIPANGSISFGFSLTYTGTNNIPTDMVVK